MSKAILKNQDFDAGANLDLLVELSETEEFIQSEAIVVGYTIGDSTFLRHVGSAVQLRGLVETLRDIVKDSGTTRSSYEGA